MGYRDTNKKKRRDKESDDGIFGIFKTSLIGAGISITAGLVFWIAATVAAYAQSDPDAVMPIFGFCAIYSSALCGGIASGKIGQEQGIVCGALSGVILSFILLFVSVFAKNAYSSGYSIVTSLLLRSAVVAVSCVGGMIGKHKKQKRRYGKR